MNLSRVSVGAALAASFLFGYYNGYNDNPSRFTPTQEELEVELVITVLDDYYEINRLYSAITGIHGYAVLGFALIHGERCVITVPKPQSTEDSLAFEVAGHELWHCTHGHWHGE